MKTGQIRCTRTTAGIALTVAYILAIASLGTSSCDEKKAREECWKWKNKTGEVLVEVDETWNEWYQHEADLIGDKILDEYPDATADELEIKLRGALSTHSEHDRKFKKAMKIGSEALDAFEESLDAWEHIKADDKGPARKAVLAGKDLVNALGDITEIVIAAGVPYEGAFNTIDTIIAGLGKLLDVLADEPDPDNE